MLTMKSLPKPLAAVLLTMLLTILTAVFSASAIADERAFPAEAKRAVLTVTKLGDLLIDGKLRATTPATRVFNEDGFILTSSSMDSVKAPILYTETEFGEIARVWLLNAEEAIKYKVKK
ncbi:hypothetical protein EJG51_006365 [Undibacterium piscinae]|uniref:Uncharacterized protein n=1 Tax=Undibacterium piscinae TaxID=2495591 RepID=A0A6M4A2G0_9BURK|nr:hypothetical protein EJG51_006365 [Undibacterium piscinae]